MAHIFITPEKDSTIFNDPSLYFQNSGRDEILQIEKRITSNIPSVSRTLIKFNINDLIQKISNGSILNPEYFLNLKACESSEIPLQYTIEAYPISQSWSMGTGIINDPDTRNGVSWKFRDNNQQNLWYFYDTLTPYLQTSSFVGCWSGSYSGSWWGYAYGKIEGIFSGSYSSSILGSGSYFSGTYVGSFNGYISGSFSGSAIINLQSNSIQYNSVDNSLIDQSGGGTWFNSQYLTTQGGCFDSFVHPTCSVNNISYCSGSYNTGSYKATQSFNFETSDISMNVSNIVNAWINNYIPNEGFILKHSGECDVLDYGKLQFYSMDTNTIYSPTLEVKWDDSIFNPPTRSSMLSLYDNVVYVNNLRSSYKYGSVSRIEVFGRDKYPKRTFARESAYLFGKVLPTSSYYSIKDAESEEIIIDFDDYTKISCDNNGNYFTLYTNGLPQERYYRIIIKIENNNNIDFYEDSGRFKITR